MLGDDHATGAKQIRGAQDRAEVTRIFHTVQGNEQRRLFAGHEVFERWFRVQQNTLELLIVFVPAISLFAIYVNPNWAAWIGLVYVAGRIVYTRAYVADPARRSLGFGLSMAPILVLLAGALIGAVRAMLETSPAG